MRRFSYASSTASRMHESWPGLGLLMVLCVSNESGQSHELRCARCRASLGKLVDVSAGVKLLVFSGHSQRMTGSGISETGRAGAQIS